MKRRRAVQSILAIAGASLSPTLLKALTDDHTRKPTLGFSAQQAPAVAAMSERIIPTTDTPGAIAAGVPAFIEEIVFAWYTDRERHIFLHGLEQTELLSRQQFGQPFVKLRGEWQDVVLRQLELQGGGSIFGGITMRKDLQEDKSAFFPKLKELVVVGYYTSEIGATQELRYEAMPMEYKGDIPLADVGRNWATSGFLD